MECGNDGHPQFAQERQNVAAGRASKYSVFVLQADDIHIAYVQEVGGAQV